MSKAILAECFKIIPLMRQLHFSERTLGKFAKVFFELKCIMNSVFSDDELFQELHEELLNICFLTKL